MKTLRYTLELPLELPRATVLELFDDPDNLTKWQPDLVSFEPISGEPGQVGAKSRLSYKFGKRECELIETVTKRELPDEFAGTYVTKGIWNEVVNRFVEDGPERTTWILETEFRPESFFMKVMMFVLPGAFRKESAKFMNYFKEYAEAEYQSRAEA